MTYFNGIIPFTDVNAHIFKREHPNFENKIFIVSSVQCEIAICRNMGHLMPPIEKKTLRA